MSFWIVKSYYTQVRLVCLCVLRIIKLKIGCFVVRWVGEVVVLVIRLLFIWIIMHMNELYEWIILNEFWNK